MISSIQNRQQNTAFGAYKLPYESTVEELRKTNAKFTTIEDYAGKLYNELPIHHHRKEDLVRLQDAGKSHILEDKDIEKLEKEPEANKKINTLINIFLDAKFATKERVANIYRHLLSIAKTKDVIAQTEEDLSKTLAKPE